MVETKNELITDSELRLEWCLLLSMVSSFCVDFDVSDEPDLSTESFLFPADPELEDDLP